ncbi:hypothetical protein J2Z31_004756 [Sinorhizobium kostiense]|uniref:Uncharacterized protein n=1 Tax=Sinorhizobium kostiense TaxID=76747 RepID=A0ABS4R7F2_9HYPH|nr:hypothetical protein [Sinorhizobium kostiense]
MDPHSGSAKTHSILLAESNDGGGLPTQLYSSYEMGDEAEDQPPVDMEIYLQVESNALLLSIDLNRSLASLLRVVKNIPQAMKQRRFSWRVLVQQMLPPSSACDAPPLPRLSLDQRGIFCADLQTGAARQFRARRVAVAGLKSLEVAFNSRSLLRRHAATGSRLYNVEQLTPVVQAREQPGRRGPRSS